MRCSLNSCLVLPLSVTVIGVHNAQAFVVLRARDHPPAVNTLSLLSGAGSLPFALFGAVAGIWSRSPS